MMKTRQSIVLLAVALVGVVNPAFSVSWVLPDGFELYPATTPVPSYFHTTHYQAGSGRVVMETTLAQPFVCRSFGGSTGNAQLVLDANAFHGGEALFGGLPFATMSYLADAAGDSTGTIDLHANQLAICHAYSGNSPVSTSATPCDSGPGTTPPLIPAQDLPLFAAGFERPDAGVVVSLRRFERDAVDSSILNFRLDIHLDGANAGVATSAKIALHEWFGHRANHFQQVLGYGAGQVSKLECQGFGGARCGDGVAYRNWLQGSQPYLARLDNGHLPDGACLRIDGQRRISPGTGVRALRYGFGVFNYGGTGDSMAKWSTVPNPP